MKIIKTRSLWAILSAVARGFLRRPSGSSVRQRRTRQHFREATAFASALDEEQRKNYALIAKQRKLRNAYTAAVQDYLNRTKPAREN